MILTPEKIKANAARLEELSRRMWAEISVKGRHPSGLTARDRFPDYHACGMSAKLREWGEKDSILRPRVVDDMLDFLKADPWFYRSGYLKQSILRRLKRAPLTPSQRQRCESLIIRCMDEPLRSCGKEYARLAGALQSPVVLEAAQKRAESKNPVVCYQAARILDRIWARRSACLSDGQRPSLP